jgi:hypothetical protein
MLAIDLCMLCRRSQSSKQQQQQLTPPPLSSSSSNAAFFPKPRHKDSYEEPRQQSRRIELALFTAVGKLTIAIKNHNVTWSSSKYCLRYRLHLCMRFRDSCSMLAESLFMQCIANHGAYPFYPGMHPLHSLMLILNSNWSLGRGLQ